MSISQILKILLTGYVDSANEDRAGWQRAPHKSFKFLEVFLRCNPAIRPERSVTTGIGMERDQFKVRIIALKCVPYWSYCCDMGVHLPQVTIRGAQSWHESELEYQLDDDGEDQSDQQVCHFPLSGFARVSGSSCYSNSRNPQSNAIPGIRGSCSTHLLEESIKKEPGFWGSALLAGL